ncbi:MAG TPA: phosphate ABC transporter substrate-binding/OmpA family protein, partial [Thermohalobaculum sp.]|nr:phosphate ABC transporter substrate-binding/OmpA family protein [Thermohalobaculum sp.]
GNSRLLRVVNPEGKEFAAITVNVDGTESGFQDLAGGEAALAIAARRVDEGEAGLNGLRDGPAERVVALDGIVVLVHPDNPLGVLTLDQIAAIFAGRITDWSQLGGPERLITLYLPGESSGTLRLFEALVMQPRGMTLDASAERVERHSDLADLVSIDPSGIGLSSSAFPRAARMVAIRRQCGLVSRPDSFSIKAEEYPLVRRLYLYGNTDGQPAQIPALADFAVSDEAQPFIASAGFANRDIESQGIDVQGGRLASSIVNPGEFSLPLFREMLGELMDAQRLSLTFRFVAGSENMEPRSQSEAARFARLLTEGAFAGSEILLVGFTDSVGDFDVNRQVAEARAGSVLDTLRTLVPADTLAGLSIQVKSYGELTPVGCNEISAGRELNRRVEVWVRNKR